MQPLSIVSPNGYPEIQWYSSKDSHPDVKEINLNQPIADGVKAAFATLGTLFTGIIVKSLYTQNMPKELVVASYIVSTAVGISVTAKAVNAKWKSDGLPKQAEKSLQASERKQFLKVIDASVKGWTAYASCVGVGVSSFFLYDKISPHTITDRAVIGLILGSAGIGISNAFGHYYSSSSKKVENALPNPIVNLNSLTPSDAEKSNTISTNPSISPSVFNSPPSEIKNLDKKEINSLSKLAKALGVGYAEYATTVTLGSLGYYFYSSHNYGLVPRVCVMGISALYGLSAAGKHYQNKPVKTPATASATSVKNNVYNLAAAAGKKNAAITYGTLLSASTVTRLMGHNYDYLGDGYAIVLSIIIGLGTYLNVALDPQTSISVSSAENNVPVAATPVAIASKPLEKKPPAKVTKLQAVGSLLASLTGLGIVILINLNSNQRSRLMYNITDMGNNGASALRNGLAAAQDQVVNLAYSKKSETTTKKQSEWIAGYSDEEEAARLIELSKLPEEEITCAEILLTCDLEPDDEGHKIAHRAKLQKFHPDKTKIDKNLASTATTTLNKVNKMLKDCQGKDEAGCSYMDQDITITTELVTPRWLYAKIRNVEPICNMITEEGALKVPQSYCANI